MREYNTQFAVMVETPEKVGLIREKGRVCLFSMREARRVIAELKKTGCTCRAIPYCE